MANEAKLANKVDKRVTKKKENVPTFSFVSGALQGCRRRAEARHLAKQKRPAHLHRGCHRVYHPVLGADRRAGHGIRRRHAPTGQVRKHGRDSRRDPCWYVVHTRTGYENKVKTDLEKTVKTGTCRTAYSRSRSQLKRLSRPRRTARKGRPAQALPLLHHGQDDYGQRVLVCRQERQRSDRLRRSRNRSRPLHG